MKLEQKKVKQNAISLLNDLNKPNKITEIGKERIRRAATKIKAETKADIDYGFKVFKVDSSNMQDVYYKPQEYNQGQLDVFADNIKEDRTSEDLLTQILLDWGLPLTLNTQKETVLYKEVFVVDTNYLLACFDDGLDEAFAKDWAEKFPSVPLINAYGPTECSDDVTHAIVDGESLNSGEVPIGIPIPNASLYVLEYAEGTWRPVPPAIFLSSPRTLLFGPWTPPWPRPSAGRSPP